MEKNDLVLVVDDDKSCRDVLRAVLELFKVRVIEAANGVKGCNLAMTKRARAYLHGSHYARDGRIGIEAFNAGCIEWLPKPWELSEVF